MERENGIGAVILAAGDSRRMGIPKSLLRIDGRTFVKSIYEKLIVAGCEPVRIVAGKHYDQILGAHPEFAHIILKNKSPDLGQLHSLRIGLESIREKVHAVLLCLVDHPFVADSTYEKVLHAFRQSDNEIIIPCYNGRRGHPVIFRENVFEGLMSIPLDEGAKPVVRNPNNRILLVEVDDPGILADVDTKEDFKRYANARNC